MDIKALVDKVRSISNCTVFPSQGIPVIAQDHILPEDLEQFYMACGGMDLFVDAVFPTRIATPNELVLANPIIFENVSQEDLEHSKGDRSWSWYIIVYGENSQYITVDLARNGSGAYYNSFWIKHPGNSEIIAYSLIELLENLLSTKGDYYWFDD